MSLKSTLKLPEEPTKKKNKAKTQLPKLPKGEVYTRIEMKELKLLLGPKPSFPMVLDFSSPEFQLETADFLLNAPNVFKEYSLPFLLLPWIASLAFLSVSPPP